MQQRASGVTYLRADKRRDDVNPSGDARSRRGRAEVEAATSKACWFDFMLAAAAAAAAAACEALHGHCCRAAQCAAEAPLKSKPQVRARQGVARSRLHALRAEKAAFLEGRCGRWGRRAPTGTVAHAASCPSRRGIPYGTVIPPARRSADALLEVDADDEPRDALVLGQLAHDEVDVLRQDDVLSRDERLLDVHRHEVAVGTARHRSDQI